MQQVADFSLAVAIGCAALIAWDVVHHPQKMKVMNWVWPITALYSGPLGLWAYSTIGRPQRHDKPFWQKVLVGSMHCGAGCTLGDCLGAWLIAGTLSRDASEFVLAYLAGIVFQYLAIVPMRHLQPMQGVVAAIKADTISLLAYEIGMFIAMGLITQGRMPSPTSSVHWLLMQGAMLAGLVTAYPANWWLLRKGLKEAM